MPGVSRVHDIVGVVCKRIRNVTGWPAASRVPDSRPVGTHVVVERVDASTPEWVIDTPSLLVRVYNADEVAGFNDANTIRVVLMQLVGTTFDGVWFRSCDVTAPREYTPYDESCWRFDLTARLNTDVELV